MSREDRSIIGLGAFAVAIAALCVALFGMRDDGSASSEGGGAATGEAAATVIDVELKEWSIGPTMTNIPPGEVTLRVTNAGTMVHNLSIPSLSAKTPDLQPGDEYLLELGSLDAGQYDVLCEIAGHAASGMTAVMMIGDGTGSDMTEGGSAVDWQVMDRQMEDVALLYPAKTAGKGGELMEYTIADDGAKVFEVTAKQVEWEVTPGNFVTATTYNGVVPGQEIYVEVGDLVRVNFHNELPESTDIHFHGIRVPWNMDGVDPYTQPVVVPGDDFVYEFVAQEIQVGIYHSHHDAQVQIPDGLFGAFTVGDMPIPEYLKDKGYTKVDRTENMVLNDAGVIGLSLNGKAFPATEPYVLRKGEVMKVNYLNEGLTAHPMHLHQPMGWIIAKDGIPLDEPTPQDTIWVSPGERFTVLYMGMEPGVWAWHCHILTHAETPTGMRYMVTALIVER